MQIFFKRDFAYYSFILKNKLIPLADYQILIFII